MRYPWKRWCSIQSSRLRRTAVAACALLLVLSAAGCEVPRHMRVRDGVDPKRVDKNVRFRTTYYFRVYDLCADGLLEGERFDEAKLKIEHAWEDITTAQNHINAAKTNFVEAKSIIGGFKPGQSVEERNKMTSEANVKINLAKEDLNNCLECIGKANSKFGKVNNKYEEIIEKIKNITKSTEEAKEQVKKASEVIINLEAKPIEKIEKITMLIDEAVKQISKAKDKKKTIAKKSLLLKS